MKYDYDIEKIIDYIFDEINNFPKLVQQKIKQEFEQYFNCKFNKKNITKKINLAKEEDKIFIYQMLKALCKSFEDELVYLSKLKSIYDIASGETLQLSPNKEVESRDLFSEMNLAAEDFEKYSINKSVYNDLISEFCYYVVNNDGKKEPGEILVQNQDLILTFLYLSAITQLNKEYDQTTLSRIFSNINILRPKDWCVPTNNQKIIDQITNAFSHKSGKLFFTKDNGKIKLIIENKSWFSIECDIEYINQDLKQLLDFDNNRGIITEIKSVINKIKNNNMKSITKSEGIIVMLYLLFCYNKESLFDEYIDKQYFLVDTSKFVVNSLPSNQNLSISKVDLIRSLRNSVRHGNVERIFNEFKFYDEQGKPSQRYLEMSIREDDLAVFLDSDIFQECVHLSPKENAIYKNNMFYDSELASSKNSFDEFMNICKYNFPDLSTSELVEYMCKNHMFSRYLLDNPTQFSNFKNWKDENDNNLLKMILNKYNIKSSNLDSFIDESYRKYIILKEKMKRFVQKEIYLEDKENTFYECYVCFLKNIHKKKDFINYYQLDVSDKEEITELACKIRSYHDINRIDSVDNPYFEMILLQTAIEMYPDDEIQLLAYTLFNSIDLQKKYDKEMMLKKYTYKNLTKTSIDSELNKKGILAIIQKISENKNTKNVLLGLCIGAKVVSMAAIAFIIKNFDLIIRIPEFYTLFAYPVLDFIFSFIIFKMKKQIKIQNKNLNFYKEELEQYIYDDKLFENNNRGEKKWK